MKRAPVIAIVVTVGLGLAFLAGFWPQHQRLNEAQAQVQALQGRLTSAEGQVRLAEALGQLLSLSDAVTARNYGEATTLASVFFDNLRAETSRTDQPAVSDTLDGILRTRDQVTAAIAQSDPALSDTLKENERRLRRALGYPLSASS